MLQEILEALERILLEGRIQDHMSVMSTIVFYGLGCPVLARLDHRSLRDGLALLGIRSPGVQLLFLEIGVSNIVPFDQDGGLFEEVANGLLLPLPFVDVPVLIAQLPVAQVEVLPHPKL